MKLLLDTHAFIWWDSQPARIPEATLNHLQQPQNTVLLSLVSLWELQIKIQLGKLSMRASLAEVVHQQQVNGIEMLAISLQHILALERLPWHHKDPFDRLLIAQSQVEQAVLVSQDAKVQQYDCPVFWE
ncbi:MAG: type II toxin-antitoxin system VapC family toxin [Spirulinaceae cyanobacterium SM2_1_0]|nr:type II toxin-antitoxin system VapC family toxin [Spirulinaceae cyanobacterium SM2_1_0]